MFARAEDNIVFGRQPGTLFDPSYMKVGLRGQVCIHCLGYLEASVASITGLQINLFCNQPFGLVSKIIY